MIKWKSIEFTDGKCKITLETGEVFTGYKGRRYFDFGYEHDETCIKLFGPFRHRNYDVLSSILGMEVTPGCCPESRDPMSFIKLYFERIGSNEEL